MSGNADRDESGRFESRVDDDEILRYFVEERPFHTAKEVADRFDIDRSTAYRRLSRMEESAGLQKVTLGSRTVVWWIPEADSGTPSPATPLRRLVGGLDPEMADDARERSDAWRESFNEEMAPDEA